MRYRLAKSDVELVPLRFCCGVPSRAGLSLLEVVLGTAILSMALAVLAQQSAVGVQAALRCQLQSEAAIHCQTQMDRLLAGRLALRTVRDQQIEGVAGWRWSVTVRSSAVPHLLE
ncbi:MAG: type IV pilus modification PilV family protein, partial [Planctomycetaceae bacterium]